MGRLTLLPRLAPLFTDELSRLLQLLLARHVPDGTGYCISFYVLMSEYAQCSPEDCDQRGSTVSLPHLNLSTVESMRQSAEEEYTARQSNERRWRGRGPSRNARNAEKRWKLFVPRLERASASGAPASSNFMPGQEGAEGKKVQWSLPSWNYTHRRVYTARFRRLPLVLSLLESWILKCSLAGRPLPRHEIRPDGTVGMSTVLRGKSYSLLRGLVAHVSFVPLCTIRQQGQMRSAEQAGPLDLKILV